MGVSAFRFAIETLEKGKWSVLCLMADDLAAARMGWTLVEMLPGDGVRIALIDPHLADKPERILWEHLKSPETEPAPVPDPIFEIYDSDHDDEATPRTFRLGSERELDEPQSVIRPKFLDQPPLPAAKTPSAKPARTPSLPDGLWPPSRTTLARVSGAVLVLTGIFGAVLSSLPDRSPPVAEQPVPAPVLPARLAAPASPPVPAPPISVAAAPKEAAALYGKWSKDARSCATDYVLYQPDRSFLFDARTALASGGPVYYDVADDGLLVFDGATEIRYRPIGPDQVQQVSFFSARTGPHPGGPTLVRCPDVDPPERVDWTPNRVDRATAASLISTARAQFEAAEAVPGTPDVPEPLRGRWGVRCDVGYLEWADGLQTSWSTFGGTEKRAISQYKQLGSRFTIVFVGGYTQFYDVVADDQIVLSGVGAQGALTDSAPPPWIGRRCP